MLIIAFLWLRRLDLILLIWRELLKRVHGVLDLLQMVAVDADGLEGGLLAAIGGDGTKVLILSGELYI